MSVCSDDVERLGVVLYDNDVADGVQRQKICQLIERARKGKHQGEDEEDVADDAPFSSVVVDFFNFIKLKR